MADSASAPPTEPQPTTPDSSLPAYRLARCLVETAKSEWQKKAKPFKSHWDYLLGKNHWALPETAAAQALDEGSCKSIRNWLFATVDHKNSVIQKADPALHVEPLEEQSTFADRLLIKAAVQHELARLRANEVHEDVYLWGSATGIGASLLTTKPDPMTGQRLLKSIPVNMNDLYPDPCSDNRATCEYLVWEPELPMSVWRSMFQAKADQIKPTGSQRLNPIGDITYRPDSSDDNLIYGAAQEFAVDRQGVQRRTARGAFVWQKDPDALEKEFQERITTGDEQGYQCISCGLYAASDAVDSPNGVPQCPLCQGNFDSATIPQGTKVSKTVITKLYPYGRLTIYSGSTLLFDGPNPNEIEEVFPFAFYHHHRVPGSFQGYGDVALLKSCQEVADKNGGMLVDATRLASLGVFEYPVGAIGYSQLGNRAGTKVPVKDQLVGRAHWITPQGINVEMWRTVDAMNQRDFQIVGGVADLSFGITSSPPISATEAEGAMTNQSARMDGHLERFNRYRTDFISILMQMARQYYEQPILVPMKIGSSVETVYVEWQKLPKAKVTVTADLRAATTDKLLGQNIQGFVSSGGLDSPYADVILQQMGAAPQQVKEIMDRKGLVSEQGQGPQPQPPSPDKVLVAIADIIKARPDGVSFEQIQQALSMAGIKPALIPDPTAPKPQPPAPTLHVHQGVEMSPQHGGKPPAPTQGNGLEPRRPNPAQIPALLGGQQ